MRPFYTVNKRSQAAQLLHNATNTRESELSTTFKRVFGLPFFILKMESEGPTKSQIPQEIGRQKAEILTLERVGDLFTFFSVSVSLSLFSLFSAQDTGVFVQRHQKRKKRLFSHGTRQCPFARARHFSRLENLCFKLKFLNLGHVAVSGLNCQYTNFQRHMVKQSNRDCLFPLQAFGESV